MWRNQRDGITIEMSHCINTISPYNWWTQEKCLKSTNGKLHILGKKRSCSFEKHVVFYRYYGNIYLAWIIISPMFTNYVRKLLATTESCIVHKPKPSVPRLALIPHTESTYPGLDYYPWLITRFAIINRSQSIDPG